MNLICATSRGFTQCARSLVFGAIANGHAFDASGVSSVIRRASSFSLKPVPTLPAYTRDRGLGPWGS